MDIFRRGFDPYQQDILASVRQGHGLIGGKGNLARGSARRRGQTAGHNLPHCVRIQSGVQ